MDQAAPEQVIEIRVRRIEQLFQSLDPSPFHERDLDPMAADYITAWAHDLHGGGPFVLRIFLADPAGARVEDVASAVGTWYAYHADMARRELRDLLAIGWLNLAIGISVLTATVLAGPVITALLPLPFSQILREGLLILGWVVNWKPLQTFLYDWIPVWRRRRLLTRLAAARVELVAAG